jgi:hypothetical protein
MPAGIKGSSPTSEMAASAARSVATCQRRLAVRRPILRALLEGPCARCDQTYPIGAMHFHHREPELKLFKIGDAAQNRADQAFFSELEKCDVLCANCHSIEHAPEWKL